jgi:dTDP-4-amino-4,6-dideoxygalactose transaminase
LIPLSNFQYDDKIVDLLLKTLQSGKLSAGENILKFEKLFSEYHNNLNVLSVSSATAGLELALRCLEIGPGDEVIVPSYTFPATANAVLARGARPVFVDIEDSTLNVDISKLNNLISTKTKAIMVVHSFGKCLHKEQLQNVRAAHGIPIIEDAACAVGSRFEDGTLSGTVGDFTIFSFHQRKILNSGEGGAVIVKDDRNFEKIKMLRSHGMKLGKYYGTFEEQGFNYRWNELAAAVATHQLKKIENEIQERNQIANMYNEAFKDIKGQFTALNKVDGLRTFQSYVLRFESSSKPDKLIEAYRSEGIEVTIGTYFLPDQPAFRQYCTDDVYPVSKKSFQQLIAIPIYSNLRDQDFQKIVNTTKVIALRD